jgi:hypothetical protein
MGNCVLLAIIILLGYSFARSITAESSNLLQAEAIVEIQYDGKVSSSIILITNYLVSSTISVASNSSTTISSLSTTSIISTITSSTSTELTSSTSNIYFNKSPLFSTSQTQIINATSTDHYVSPTATDCPRGKANTMATQNLLKSNSSFPLVSIVVGLGIRPNVT